MGFGEGAVNDSGQMIFAASLVGPNVTADVNDNAIWYDAGDGVMRVLFRTGDTLTFDGQTKVIADNIWAGARFISTGGWGNDTFNNAGQFTAALSFTDGSSGVFLFQIPEPSWLGLVALPAGALMRRRSRANSGY
jgi:hypothetical protein